MGFVPENLIASWPRVDSRELRVLIDEVVGRPGQYWDRDTNPNTLYVPLAGASCRLVLTFRGREITKVEPGPAFDAGQWRAICRELDGTTTAPTVFGREYSFSSYRVPGWWQGTRSGVQILPPPPDAPRADLESADHPFVLEFPIAKSAYWALTNYRRIREHRNLTLFLNTRLAGRTSLISRRPRHIWAGLRENGDTKIRWVQEFFFARLGEVVTDSASPVIGEQLPQLEPERYYEEMGHDGRGLFVPSDLDESIVDYYELARDKRAALNRAMFWMDMASREWTVSMSSSFAALVSAVESLIQRGSVHRTFCEQCNDMRQHDDPGAAEQFRAFLERYAPGLSRKQRRSEMYALRSNILHGSELMDLDGDWVFGSWDPPRLREDELHEELWGLTRSAIRNWLTSTTAAEPASATSTEAAGESYRGGGG